MLFVLFLHRDTCLYKDWENNSFARITRHIRCLTIRQFLPHSVLLIKLSFYLGLFHRTYAFRLRTTTQEKGTPLGRRRFPQRSYFVLNFPHFAERLLNKCIFCIEVIEYWTGIYKIAFVFCLNSFTDLKQVFKVMRKCLSHNLVSVLI